MTRYTFVVVDEIDGPSEVVVLAPTYDAALSAVMDKYPEGTVVGVSTAPAPEEGQGDATDN